MYDWLVAIPVWGDAYHAVLEKTVWPSIKRSLAGVSGHVRFCFHTDDPDACRNLIGPGADAVFLWPSAGETWMSYSQAHRESAAFARKGEVVAFLNADIVVSEECFAASERRFAEGKRAIVMQATRTIGALMQPPPLNSRGLLAWSMLYAHNMARECFWGQGKTVVPCTLYYMDDANVILRAFFLHPFAAIKDGEMNFNGTIDQDGIDSIAIEHIHVVTDPDEMALAEISLSLTRRLPVLNEPMTEETVMGWAAGATSAHHREYFKKRIVLVGSADTTCDAPATQLVHQIKYIKDEQECSRRWNFGALAHMEGRMSKAVECWIAAMEYQHEQAEKHGLPRNPRYLTADWTSNIGHPTYLDMFIKGMRLGMFDCEYVLLADMERVSTPTYVRLFTDQIKTYRKSSFPLYYGLTKEPTAILKVESKWMWFVDAHCMIEKRWREQGGKPLIRLPDTEIEEGWEKIGLDPGRDWFVALHCRQSKDLQSGRDGEPASYNKAIRLIEDAGGVCISVPTGDRALDIFVLSQARFVIGSNAGPSLVAGTFGVPFIGANWAPVGIGYAWEPAIILPKRTVLNGRVLTDDEMRKEPYNHLENPEWMRKMGVELLCNSQDEIAAAAQTMLEMTEGRANDAMDNTVASVGSRLRDAVRANDMAGIGRSSPG